MQAQGAAAALQALENIHDKRKLESYYIYYSLLGEIHARLLNKTEAFKNFEAAINLTRSAVERKMLRNKIVSLESIAPAQQ